MCLYVSLPVIVVVDDDGSDGDGNGFVVEHCSLSVCVAPRVSLCWCVSLYLCLLGACESARAEEPFMLTAQRPVKTVVDSSYSVFTQHEQSLIAP